MRVNYQTNAGTQFRILSDDQLEEMVQAVLRVLEEIGLDVHNDEARQILGENGASVEELRVRIPSYMVKQALSTAPRSFTIWARDGDPQARRRDDPRAPPPPGRPALRAPAQAGRRDRPRRFRGNSAPDARSRHYRAPPATRPRARCARSSRRARARGLPNPPPIPSSSTSRSACGSRSSSRSSSCTRHCVDLCAESSSIELFSTAQRFCGSTAGSEARPERPAERQAGGSCSRPRPNRGLRTGLSAGSVGRR